MKRALSIAAVAVGLVAPSQGCETNDDLVYDGAPIQAVYVTDDGQMDYYLSERDCGFSVDVAGQTPAGTTETRTIWGFCDPFGFSKDGVPWAYDLVPSNGYGIIATDASPISRPIVSPIEVFQDQPSGVKRLIPDTDNDCTLSEMPFSREWIHGMIRLPDRDPRYETLAVFYQNFCIDSGDGLDFGAGGISYATWDSQNPDAPLVGTRMTDEWLQPGWYTDHRVPWNIRTFSYGSAPILIERGNQADLYTYMCGAAGDCAVARSTFTIANSGASTALFLADTANWTYWTGSGWHPFPPATLFGTCSPTALETCDPNYPPAAVIATASADDPFSQPAGEVSIRQADGVYYMLYAYGSDEGFAYRTASSPTGPFSAPRKIATAPNACGGCRAPIWHPGLDDDEWAFSYYDMTGLNGLVVTDPPRRVGRIKITSVSPLPPLHTD